MTSPRPDAVLSLDELIESIGVDPEYGAKIWTAFGFGHHPGDAKLFTEADRDAFAVFARGASAVDETAQIATARAIGQSLARLAAWQADQLLEIEADPEIGLSVDQIAAALSRIQRLVWRLHLAIALEGSRSSTTDRADRDTTIGFVDVVGYTSLSRRIDHTELTELISSFEDQVSALITTYDGQVIKTLGDGVLFENSDPALAALTALAVAELSDTPPIPALRTGLAHGEVLARLGDAFGEPVNIAARLCGSARPGTVLIDDNLADALEGDPRFRVRPIPPLSVRGYRRLRAFALSTAKK